MPLLFCEAVPLPDLPTLDEAGLTGFDVGSWDGVFATGRPLPEIIASLNSALRGIIDNPEVKARLALIGFETRSSTPQELGNFAEPQRVKWAKMIPDAGIGPE